MKLLCICLFILNNYCIPNVYSQLLSGQILDKTSALRFKCQKLIILKKMNFILTAHFKYQIIYIKKLIARSRVFDKKGSKSF